MIDFIGRIVTAMGVKELSRKEGRGKIEKRRSVEFSLSIFIQSFFPSGELRAQKWRGQEKELKQEVLKLLFPWIFSITYFCSR